MAQIDQRETVVRKLLEAHRLHNLCDSSLRSQLSPNSVLGFPKGSESFLTSVATQVESKHFITIKQFAIVQDLLDGPTMWEQFSLDPGRSHPALPANFRWVGFEDEGKTRIMTYSSLPDNAEVMDDGSGVSESIQVGGITLDFSVEEAQPWGVLSVEDDELVFEPKRYPTRQIKQAKFRWDAGTKTWRHRGVHREVVEKVLSLWDAVSIDDTVEEALAEAVELAELPENITNHGTLFEFQKEASQFIHTHKRCLLALAPGLGKTATAIVVAHELLGTGEISRVGIFAPKSLLKTWQNEIWTWAEDWSCILHNDFSDQPLDADWYIINYDTLSRQKSLPEELEACDLIIFDESILLKSHGRKKEKKDGKQQWVFKTQRVQGAFELAKDVERIWLLSGGPTSKYLDDLWAQFHLIDPKRFSSYWRFAGEYCHIQHNGWAKEVTGNKPGAIGRIQENFADIYYCRTQDQCLDLPDWVFEAVEVPMSRKQEAMYEEMNSEWMTTLRDQTGEVKLYAPNTITQVIRLSQIASNPIILGKGLTAISPKWAAVEELLQLRPLPAIIWTRFIATAQRMEHHLQRLGYRVGLLTGSTAANIRADIVGAFQKGGLDVIVAHPKVGKFGLTLTEARTSIYLEASYDGDDYYQSLHRVRRIGTTHSPIVIMVKSIYADGRPTVDHLVADVLAAKADTTFKVTSARLANYLEGGEPLWQTNNSKPSG